MKHINRALFRGDHFIVNIRTNEPISVKKRFCLYIFTCKVALINHTILESQKIKIDKNNFRDYREYYSMCKLMFIINIVYTIGCHICINLSLSILFN